MKRLLTLTLLMTAGCYSKSNFTEDVSTAFCTLYDDCDYLEVQQFDDYDECYDNVTVNMDPENQDCDWDAGAAKECVEGINAMSCDELYAADFPFACNQYCNRQ